MDPRLQKIRDDLGDRCVAIILFGSRLYGTAVEGSDTDYKGIFLPTADEILIGKQSSGMTLRTNPSASGGKNGPDDIDIEFFSLYRFLELLMEGQSNATDMLFCPADKFIVRTPLFDRVWDNRQVYLNRRCNQAIGYAYAQANKYGQRGNRIAALEYVVGHLEMAVARDPQQTLGDVLAEFPKFFNNVPTEACPFIKKVREDGPQLPGGFLEHLWVCGKQAGYTSAVKQAYALYKKELDEYGDRARAAKRAGGVDTKALYHALRIVEQTVELLQTGHVTFPRPEAEYLLKIRRGEVTGVEVGNLIEKGFDRIRAAQKTSVLREEPDRRQADRLVMEINLGIIQKEYGHG